MTEPNKFEAAFVEELTASSGESVAIYRAPCGGLFGIDSSFIEQQEPKFIIEPFDSVRVRLIND